MNEFNMKLQPLSIQKKYQLEMKDIVRKGNLTALKEYFSYSNKTNNEIYKDLQYNINQAYLMSVNNGQLEIVKYCLTTSELNIHADIEYNNNEAICIACAEGYTNIVQYLLTSPELKKHADIKPYLDDIITNACDIIKTRSISENYNYVISPSTPNPNNNNYEILLNYLIYDYLIEPTKIIIEKLKEALPESFYTPALKQLKNNVVYHNIHYQIKDITPGSENKRLKI